MSLILSAARCKYSSRKSEIFSNWSPGESSLSKRFRRLLLGKANRRPSNKYETKSVAEAKNPARLRPGDFLNLLAPRTIAALLEGLRVTNSYMLGCFRQSLHYPRNVLTVKSLCNQFTVHLLNAYPRPGIPSQPSSYSMGQCINCGC